MTPAELQSRSTEVLQRLIRFNTVNPPGNERAAIEYLDDYVGKAGFETEILGAEPERPNLVADLNGAEPGPTLCFLGHVDTVLADPDEWQHDPWSGDVVDGFLWGRGALDMKSQVAAEAVGAAELARSGWRPARGTLKLVFVADEETGGDVGAHWLTSEHPDKVRCDMLLNEGAGRLVRVRRPPLLRRLLRREGDLPLQHHRPRRGRARLAAATGDNALLKLAPVLARLADQPDRSSVTEARRRSCAASARIPTTRRRAGGGSKPRSIRGCGSMRRADARGHADADDGQRVGQDQRDPLARPDPRRLPRAAGPRRGRRAPADRPTCWAGRDRRPRDRVHRAGRRQPVDRSRAS